MANADCEPVVKCRAQSSNAVNCAFTPVLAKHIKNLNMAVLTIIVERVQRNLRPMRKQVETWKSTRLVEGPGLLRSQSLLVGAS